LPTRPSLAGRDPLERTRSTAFALLGITTAIGLVLVAIVAQQNWPYLPAIPIPGLESKHGATHGTTAAVAARIPAAHGKRLPGPALGRAGGRRQASEPAPAEPDLSSSRRLVAPPSPVHSPAVPQATPDSPPDPQLSPQPPAGPAPPSAPAAPPVAAAPPSSPPPPAAGSSVPSHGKGNAYGKYKPSPAAKEKAPHSEPPTPPQAPAPVAAPADDPAEPEPSPPLDESPGNGHGHAYGHYR
jgi:hypothetical protein